MQPRSVERYIYILYVYTYIHINIYAYVCIRIHVHTQAHTHTHTHTHTHRTYGTISEGQDKEEPSNVLPRTDSPTNSEVRVVVRNTGGNYFKYSDVVQKMISELTCENRLRGSWQVRGGSQEAHCQRECMPLNFAPQGAYQCLQLNATNSLSHELNPGPEGVVNFNSALHHHVLPAASPRVDSRGQKFFLFFC